MSKVTLDVEDVLTLLHNLHDFLVDSEPDEWTHPLERQNCFEAYHRVKSIVEDDQCKLHVASIEYGSEEYTVGVFTTECGAERAARQAVKDFHAAYKNDRSRLSPYMKPSTCEFDVDVYANPFERREAINEQA